MTSMNSGVSIASLYLVMGTVVHADDFGSLSQIGASLEADQSIFKEDDICLSYTFSHSPPYFRYSAMCYLSLSFHT